MMRTRLSRDHIFGQHLGTTCPRRAGRLPPVQVRRVRGPSQQPRVTLVSGEHHLVAAGGPWPVQRSRRPSLQERRRGEEGRPPEVSDKVRAGHSHAEGGIPVPAGWRCRSPTHRSLSPPAGEGLYRAWRRGARTTESLAAVAGHGVQVEDDRGVPRPERRSASPAARAVMVVQDLKWSMSTG